MHSQHNPIAQRIDEMRRVWTEKVKKDSVLVRWLLEPDDSRMYEGFCRLESSPHGTLNEFFVFFYTPFDDINSFSKNIIRDWLTEVKANTDLKRQVQESGIPIHEWNYKRFEDAIIINNNRDFYNSMLIDLMDSFRQLSNQPDIPLVLSLLPTNISQGGFAQWLNEMMQKKFPLNLRILVFDHLQGNYWGNLFEMYRPKTVTLTHDLRMEDAIRQIATGGDPNKPDVQFRKCMYEMGDASGKKQLHKLHEWGKKAVEVGTKSGQKDLLATAYITYAGMLFTFKEYQTIQFLLDTGIRVCKTAISSGNETVKPLLLQFYGYKAAAFQQQKDTKQAFEWFMKQGREAHEFGLFAQSISGYHKAYLLAQFKNLQNEQVDALATALNNTSHLQNDEIKTTEYPYIAYDYVMLTRQNIAGTDYEKAGMINDRMQEIFGAGWLAIVEGLKQNFNRQHVQQTEAAATVTGN